MQTRTSENGAAMLMALMLVVSIGALLAAVTQGSRMLSAETIDERARAQALQAAEGGLEQARWRLAAAPEFAGETIRVGAADVVIVVEPLGANADQWRVEATATCLPRGSHGLGCVRRVTATLRAAADLPSVVDWRELP